MRVYNSALLNNDSVHRNNNNISESCPFGCVGHRDCHLLSVSVVMTMSVSSFFSVMLNTVKNQGPGFIDCRKVGKEL